MESDLNRRRFLQGAGAGIVASAATVAAPTTAAEQTATAPAIPLPDVNTKATAVGTAPQAACCIPSAKLIFACSGSADVGKICDQAARKLSEEGVGKMYCLAGVGGRVKTIMEGTQAAKAILVLDGCPLQCARNTMEQAGFKKFEYLCLAELGMEKGKTPATEDTIAKVATHGRNRLAQGQKP